jgi:hypothetical protein
MKTIAMFVLSIGVLVVLCGVFAHYWDRFPRMPAGQNILRESGIGPVTLPGKPTPKLCSSFWLVITAMSLLGGGCLLTVIGVSAADLASRVKVGRMSVNEAAGVFLLLSIVIYLLPVFVGGFFDRYLIPTIPLLIATITRFSSHLPGFPRASIRVFGFAAVAVLIASCLFAVDGTRDYLAVNRVRWEALHDLMGRTSAKAEEIDGGFEFVGLYLYKWQHQGGWQKSWWGGAGKQISDRLRRSRGL